MMMPVAVIWPTWVAHAARIYGVSKQAMLRYGYHASYITFNILCGGGASLDEGGSGLYRYLLADTRHAYDTERRLSQPSLPGFLTYLSSPPDLYSDDLTDSPDLPRLPCSPPHLLIPNFQSCEPLLAIHTPWLTGQPPTYPSVTLDRSFRISFHVLSSVPTFLAMITHQPLFTTSDSHDRRRGLETRIGLALRTGELEGWLRGIC